MDMINDLPLDEEEYKKEALVITYTFKNGKDIDLNLSNIKNKRFKITPQFH